MVNFGPEEPDTMEEGVKGKKSGIYNPIHHEEFQNAAATNRHLQHEICGKKSFKHICVSGNQGLDFGATLK